MRATAARVGDALDGVVEWLSARLRSQRWVWLVPLVVLLAMLRASTSQISHVTGAIVAAGVVVWAIRRPGSALIALIVFLPLQTVGFGFLLRLGVPTQVLRPAGGLKEMLGIGLLVSALHTLHDRRSRLGVRTQLDAIDKALLAYVAVVTAYLLVPSLFTLFPVSGRWSVRLLAWRADCGYVLLFFAVRHAPISDAARKRFLQVLIGLAVLTVGLGFYQWAAPASWGHLILYTGRQIQYQLTVLGNDSGTVTRNLGYLTNDNPLRISSIFLSPFDMADYLLIVLAIGIERITRNVRSRSSYVLCGIILMALFASRVRADALAAVILALVALVPTPNRPVAARVRLLCAILVGAAVVIPALGGTRFVNAEGGAQSNTGHISEITGGLAQLAHDPLGIGIGNAAGVGDRFVLTPKHQGGFTVDNVVLQVGDELGVQALLPWLVVMILVWRALGRAARQPDPFTGGMRLALLGMFIAGMYHQVFLSFPVTWSLWAAIGLALPGRVTTDRAKFDRFEVKAEVIDVENPGGADQEADSARGNIQEIDALPSGDSD